MLIRKKYQTKNITQILPDFGLSENEINLILLVSQQAGYVLF